MHRAALKSFVHRTSTPLNQQASSKNSISLLATTSNLNDRMPPKKDSDDDMKEKLKTMCLMMVTAKEFEPDFDALATLLGIAQPRNV